MKACIARTALCVVVLLIGGGGRIEAGFIVNGGFEAPVANRPFQTLTGTQLSGWFISSGSIDLINGYWPALEGQQSVDLAGSTRDGGVLEQTFATTPGATYLLTFDYANNVDVSSATANVSVFGNEVLLSQDLTHSGSSAASLEAMGYTSFSGSFTADSTSTTLRFTSTGPHPVVNANNGIVLDNVAVTQVVPAPSTLGMLAFGGLSLLAWHWRCVRRVA